MALDWSFEPDPDLKGSYYRRLEDIPEALAKFDVTTLPANSPAQFVAYYFGAEKLAKAIVGINHKQPAAIAFHHRVGVRLPETKSAARNMGLSISEAPVTIVYTEYSLRKGQRLGNAVNIIWEMLLARLHK